MAMILEPRAPLVGNDVLALADAKAFLRIDGSDEDTVVSALRDAAIDWVERYTAKGLSSRAWRLTTVDYRTPLRLGVGPIKEITSVSFVSRDGGEVDLEHWRFDDGAVWLGSSSSWLSPPLGLGSVQIDFVAGFDEPATQAPGLLVAVRLMLQQLYDNRGSSDPSLAVLALSAPYRSPVIG